MSDRSFKVNHGTFKRPYAALHTVAPQNAWRLGSGVWFRRSFPGFRSHLRSTQEEMALLYT